jgi:hypothetical protein
VRGLAEVAKPLAGQRAGRPFRAPLTAALSALATGVVALTGRRSPVSAGLAAVASDAPRVAVPGATSTLAGATA